jgi:hypothetical protein
MLLISYSFPPDSIIGALRWEKLLGYAAERGWRADVITMDPAEAEVRDDSRLATLPPGTRVWSVARHTPWPRRVERWLAARWVARRGPPAAGAGAGTSPAASGNSPKASPGAPGRVQALRRAFHARMHFREWKRWADDCAALGIRLAATAGYDLVVSSGPPQMAHEAARQVAEHTGLPFVLDLRDQFYSGDVQPPALRSRTWLALTKRYERQCLEAAQLIVTNTHAIERLTRERFPALADRLLTVMNGSDPDAKGTRAIRAPFTVTHAGSLYHGRDPRSLLQGCRLAIDELGVGPDAFRIHFFGDDMYESLPVMTMAEQEGVRDYTLAERQKPRADALRLQEESAVLVVLPQHQSECIPGKVFDYVQIASWLLVLTDEGSAAELLLRGTDVDIVSPQDPAMIGRCLVKRYREFQAGERPQAVNRDGRFDRRVQAQLLFDEIETRLF